MLEKHPDGSAKLVEMENDAIVKKTRTILSYDYEGPGRITWEQEQGDPKWLTGDLGADRDRRRAAPRPSTRCSTDPGRMLGLLLRGPVEGKVKEFLTKGAAEGLKEQVEAGG